MADDLYNLIDSIETDWSATGRSLSDLLFVVCTDHPTTAAQARQRVSYPDAVRNTVAPQIGSDIAVIDIGDWWTVAKLQAGLNGLGGVHNYYSYAGSEDQNHLSVPGVSGRSANGYWAVLDPVFDTLLGMPTNMSLAVNRNAARKRSRINRVGSRTR